MCPSATVLLTLVTLTWVTSQQEPPVLDQVCHEDDDGPHEKDPCHPNYNIHCYFAGDPVKKCVCNIRHVAYPSLPGACIHPDLLTGTKRVGEACDKEGCIHPLFCNLDHEPKPPVCKCPAAKPQWSTVKEDCEVKGPGSPCVPADRDCAAALECTAGGTCGQCPNDLQWDGDEKCRVKVGGACTAHDQCLPNAECVANKCKCVVNYALSDVDKTCDPHIVPIGGKCSEKKACLPDKGLDCTDDGTCSCTANSEWVEGSCKEKKDLLTCDPEAEVDSCAENEVKNLECDKVKRICTCPSDTVYSDTAKACKLKGGEPCTVPAVGGTAEHGLCHSQYCVDVGYKNAYGTCDCKDGSNGQRRVWTSDPPGCVDDKSGFACTKNEDCQFPNLKRGREGLICQDNHCVCKPGYNYQYGYCFKDEDNKGHDMDCDPKGIDTVCNIKGTGLACRSTLQGTETTHKCLCLSKDVMRGAGAENKKYVELVWDAAQGKCALKAEGETCVDAEECRGKVCDKEKCVGDGKAKKRGGAKVVASADAELTLILLTSAVVLRQF